MDKLIIRGGRPLHGEVTISGAKNSALPLMAATLLTPGVHVLHNIPKLHDVMTMLKLLKHLGTDHVWKQNALHLNTEQIRAVDAPYDVVRTMRASVLVMGPLVARLRKARVSLPGGCAIGARPIDLHLKALEEMGCKINLHDGYVDIEAAQLSAKRIFFSKVTVTGTANIMMASLFSKGETILENCAREPEIVDLAQMLNQMGASIDGAGTARVSICGVDHLTPVSYRVSPDRIEAGTFMMAAAITKGDILLKECPAEALETAIEKLRQAGASIEQQRDTIRVVGPEQLRAVNITTDPHPGFPTDLQAQFMALMTTASGTSRIEETIFENRFMHAPELNRMGGKIAIDDAVATVQGVQQLHGAPVMATDLRASASLVLAGLAAQGTTEIRRIYHLDRGYEGMEVKLRKLGADIVRVSE